MNCYLALCKNGVLSHCTTRLGVREQQESNLQPLSGNRFRIGMTSTVPTLKLSTTGVEPAWLLHSILSGAPDRWGIAGLPFGNQVLTYGISLWLSLCRFVYKSGMQLLHTGPCAAARPPGQPWQSWPARRAEKTTSTAITHETKEVRLWFSCSSIRATACLVHVSSCVHGR